MEHQRGKFHDRRSDPERARGNRKKEVQRGEGFKRQKVSPIKGGDPVSWAPLREEVCGRIALRQVYIEEFDPKEWEVTGRAGEFLLIRGYGVEK